MGKIPFNPDNYTTYLCKLQYCHNPKTTERCTILTNVEHKSSGTEQSTSSGNWLESHFNNLFGKNENHSNALHNYKPHPFYFVDWIQRNKAEKDFYTFSRKDNSNLNYIVNAFSKNLSFQQWCQQKHCEPSTLKITHHDWSRLGKELQLSVSFNDGSKRLLEVVCFPTRTSKNNNLTNKN